MVLAATLDFLGENESEGLNDRGASSPSGSRLKNQRGYKEIPQGSFGSGGWGSGGNGKYPRPSFEECEKIRKTIRNLIIRKYGSVSAGWQDLDTNSDFRLSYFEFVRGSPKLGLNEPRRLWASLDLDRCGYVSLQDLDPDLAQNLGSLAFTIWKVFGSLQVAWTGCFNQRGTMRIELQEFVRACDEIEFQGDAEKAFAELCTEKAGSGLSRQEFGFLNSWIARGKPDRFWEKDIDEPVENFWMPPAEAKNEKQELLFKFKDLLLRSYRDFVRAWRHGLDKKNIGKLDYKEFSRACKDVGFAGNQRLLWEELDVTGSGFVSLLELDRPTAELLKDFVSCAVVSFGSWENAWQQAMDLRGDNRIKLRDFVNGCRMIGYKADAMMLFDLLDIDRTKYLTKETTCWLSEDEKEHHAHLEASERLQSSVQTRTIVACQRRSEIIARDQRVRRHKFLARARGEIPGSSKFAGTSVSSPGQTFMTMTSKSSQDLMSTQSSLASAVPKHKGYRRPAELKELPEWLLIAEGRAHSPPPKVKMDLTFPLFPQSPGKGGWPARKLKNTDELWGGSKDIGQLLSPSTRRACSESKLARWQAMAMTF